jgi:hypothetical protein
LTIAEIDCVRPSTLQNCVVCTFFVSHHLTSY